MTTRKRRLFEPGESYLLATVATAAANSSVNARNAAGDSTAISISIVNVARRCSTAPAREANARLIRIVGQCPEQRGTHDEGAGCDFEHPFDAAAPLPFFDDLKEALAFQFAQVIVQCLARQPQPGRQRRR